VIHCRFATRLHTEAREGTLSGLLLRVYRLHMRMCPPCQAWAKGLDQTDAALKSVPTEPAPDELKRALAARLRARKT
jgi:hypothetical protein